MDLPLTSDEVDVVQYALLYLKQNFHKTDKPNELSDRNIKDIDSVLSFIKNTSGYEPKIATQ
tara:strand:+ start:392 stop:577 length:186 start_codon:yes stop_codon:yes gene_type:complete